MVLSVVKLVQDEEMLRYARQTLDPTRQISELFLALALSERRAN